jgi:hypothetical protein
MRSASPGGGQSFVIHGVSLSSFGVQILDARAHCRRITRVLKPEDSSTRYLGEAASTRPPTWPPKRPPAWNHTQTWPPLRVPCQILHSMANEREQVFARRPASSAEPIFRAPLAGPGPSHHDLDCLMRVAELAA